VEQSSTGRVTVALDLAADVWVEIDAKGRQTLVLFDDNAEIRISVPAPSGDHEFPYLLVLRLARRIEREAEAVKRNALGWHGPVGAAGGWAAEHNAHTGPGRFPPEGM